MNTYTEATVPNSAHTQHTARGLPGKRVVLCGDAGLTLMQMQRALTLAGLDVVGAVTTGAEAVDLVLRERPDLVLMDLSMPVMDGLQASRRILGVYPVCIVLLTGHAPKRFEPQAQQAGICGYLLKPFTSEDLLRVLPQALQRFSERGERDKKEPCPGSGAG